MLRLIPVFLSLMITRGNSIILYTRDGCSDNFSKCSPQGAISANTPGVGPGLSSFYVDMVHSTNGIHIKKRHVQELAQELDSRAVSNDFCCADGTSCLVLQDLQLPFCYDKFTTNYYLPGGAYGTVASGDYTSNGDVANLITGNFTLANGASGNIYGSPFSPSKPDTSTLTIPTQFTGIGIGNVIPLTALGEEVTFTTTIPGTTVPPSTISVETTSTSLVSGKTVSQITLKPATTIPGTTISPRTTTITTTKSSSPTSTSSATQLGCTFYQVVVLGFLLFLMLSV